MREEPKTDTNRFARPSFKVFASQGTTLPVLATANDVRETVRLLKRTPDGITTVQASDAFRKRLFDPRKISAYEFWGIISRDRDRLKLSSLGWEFAEKFMPEADAYRTVLRETVVYDATLVWIYEQRLEVVTCVDLGGFWRERFPEAVQDDDEENLESSAASFFQICHAGDLGMLTIGRKGHSTRLLVHPKELKEYIQRANLQLKQAAPNTHDIGNGNGQVVRQRYLTLPDSERSNVFISHSHNEQVVARIQEVLELADVDSVAVERTSDSTTLISERSFEALRRCDVAIFVISERDFCEDRAGGVGIAEKLFVEVGGAFTHLDRRVLLLLQNRTSPLPPILSGIPSCEFDGQELTWDTGIHLVRTVKDFRQKNQSPRADITRT